jgi:hypothetical protein
MKLNRTTSLLSTAIVLLSLTVSAFGQAGPGGGPGGGGPGGPGGQGGPGGPGAPGAPAFGQAFDPSMIGQIIQQRQQNQLNNIKTLLGSSDDEFAALSPFILKIMQMQALEQINQFRSMMSRGGLAAMAARAGPQAQAAINNPQAQQMMQQVSSTLATFNFGQPPSELQIAGNELTAAIEDNNSTPDFLANKLAAYRAARNKAADDLLSVQNQLKQLLTQKQEGTLVMQGLLP